MSFGPEPWQQRHWDWRAAGNFVCGGAGAGLIVYAAIFGAATPAFAALVLAGLALVGLGLFCVWLEIGRPLRALHVFFNPRTSWMTREAFVATLLFPVALAAAAGIPACAWMAAATNSLPTPLSPVTSTFASERATRSISSRSSFIAALSPIS